MFAGGGFPERAASNFSELSGNLILCPIIGLAPCLAKCLTRELMLHGGDGKTSNSANRTLGSMLPAEATERS